LLIVNTDTVNLEGRLW